MITERFRLMLRPVHLRTLFDRLARAIITVGGLATIVSILGIFFFLFREVTPLFTAPSAKLTQRLSVPALLVDEGPAQVAVDEHREIAQVFTSGAIQFFDLASGQPIPLEMPAQVTSRQITAMASGGGNAPRLAVGTADGEVLFLKVGTTTEFTDQGERRKRPHIRAGQPIPLTKSPIVRLAYRANDHGSLLALLSKGGRLLVVRIAADDVAGDHPIITELPQPKGAVTALALDALLENLYVGTADGQVVHVALSETESPEMRAAYTVAASSTAVTTLGFLSGDRSLVVMSEDGAVSTWGLVRRADAPSGWTLTQIHTLRAHNAPVTAFAPSQRVKGFVTGDMKGNLFLHHATSSQTLLRLANSEFPIRAVAFAPKGDGLIALDGAGQLSLYQVQNAYPEVTLETLFGKVWYEGYDQPAHVWQSSSGSDDVEPKLGLLPLAFGTLKGTMYALFLAVPIAILAAMCTSQFMHQDLRAKIKPIIEVMAALPTVVLGFLAGLWLAPLLERMLPAVAGMALVLPLLVVVASFAWYLCPLSVKRHLPQGQEALLLIPILGLGSPGASGPIRSDRRLVVRRERQGLALEPARHSIRSAQRPGRRSCDGVCHRPGDLQYCRRGALQCAEDPNRRLARVGSDSLANRSASGAVVRQPGNLFRRDDRVRARDRGNHDRPDGHGEYSHSGLELGERLSDAVGQYRRGNSGSPAWRKSLSGVVSGRLAPVHRHVCHQLVGGTHSSAAPG
jgi:phosphate transport system permease protein